MNKRGVAPIVVAVLVIAISIVGAGLVFVAVTSFVDDGSDNEDLVECLALDLSPILCKFNTDTNVTSVSVVRGSGEADLDDVRFVFDTSEGSVLIDRDASNFGELETRVFEFNQEDVSGVLRVDVAGVLSSGGICPLGGVGIDCSGTNEEDNGDGNNDDGNNQEGWIVLNGGNPVDAEDGIAGDGVSDYDLSGDRSYVDSSGNLILFYHGSDPYLSEQYPWRDLRVVRLNSNKDWQFLGFDGWTGDSSGDAYPSSFGGAILQVDRLILSKLQSGSIFGIVSAAFHMGAKGIDIHGSPQNFNYDLSSGDLSFWRRQGTYPYLGQSLLYNWGGVSFNGGDFSFGNSEGLLVSNEKSNVAKPFNLIASKYDSTQDIWLNWNNSQWEDVYANSPQNREYDYLPFLENPTNLGPMPRVENIPGTNDYLITFIFESSQGERGIGAAMYKEDNVDKWLTWDGSSWNTDYDNKAILVEMSTSNQNRRSESARVSLMFDGSVYEFYSADSSEPDMYELRKLSYDIAGEVWSYDVLLTLSENSPVEGGRFAVNSYNGKIWIALEDGDDVLFYSYDGTNLESLGKIYSASGGAYPYVVNSYDGETVVFVISEAGGIKRIFAVGNNSEGYWDDEVRRNPKSAASLVSLDSSKGVQEDQWLDLVVFASRDDGSGGDVEYSMGPRTCGHLGIDSEENIYCPGQPIFDSAVGIYPGDYAYPDNRAEETAHVWGGTEVDYFFGGVGAVAVDNANGYVYVLDRYMNGGGGDVFPQGRIQIWDKSKNSENVASKVNGNNYGKDYTPEIVSRISGERIEWPSDVAVDESRSLLYLTESAKGRVVVFDTDSSGSPSYSREITGLKFPQGIDTDSSGNVYVVDSENNKIVKYDPSGNKVLEWGDEGRDDGEFLYPYAIAVDKVQDYVYVSDPYNRRVQIFDLEGNFIYQFSSWINQNPDESAINFNHVGGLAVNDGMLYVTTYNRNSQPKRGVIVKFNMTL